MNASLILSTLVFGLKFYTLCELLLLLIDFNSGLKLIKLTEMYPSFAKKFVERQRFTEEDQQIYNNHIIENFIERVNEMNGTVLIPSKLKDLENPQNPLNEDLYQCFRMINTVKRDLFEPSLQK